MRLSRIVLVLLFPVAGFFSSCGQMGEREILSAAGSGQENGTVTGKSVAENSGLAGKAAPFRKQDLSRLVNLLENNGCIDNAGIAESLRQQIEQTPLHALAQHLTAQIERHVCSAGAAILLATANSPVRPEFETAHDRILFDLEGDGCLESVLSVSQSTLTRYDADNDGCLDRIWNFGRLVANLPIPENLAGVWGQEAQNVAVHLIPPPNDLQSPGFDFAAHRAQAEPLLDQLILSTQQENLAPETTQLLAQYLENTRPFVREFRGCEALTVESQPGEEEQIPAPGDGFLDEEGRNEVDNPLFSLAKDNGGSATPPLRFYVYTTKGHSWKALEQGDNVYQVGLYKSGYGKDKGKAGKVPESPPQTATGSGSGRGAGGSSGSSGSGSSSGSSADSSTSSSADDGSSGGVFNGPGVVRNDKTDGWNYRICWEIKEAEWKTIAKSINGHIDETPEYRFFSLNCLGWAVENAALIKRTVPDYTNWGVPDPEVLMNTLKKNAGKTINGGKVEKNPKK